jgi:hypothetical protein
MKYHILLIATLATPLIVPNPSRAQLAKAEPAPASHTSSQMHYALAVADRYGASLPASPAGQALIIPKDPARAKSLADIGEDLNVMARILAKAATGDGDQPSSAMGINIRNSLFGSGTSPQNLYLEGYGVLFFLNVNYPLIAPPAKSPEPEAKDATALNGKKPGANSTRLLSRDSVSIGPT